LAQSKSNDHSNRLRCTPGPVSETLLSQVEAFFASYYKQGGKKFGLPTPVGQIQQSGSCSAASAHKSAHNEEAQRLLSAQSILQTICQHRCLPKLAAQRHTSRRPKPWVPRVPDIRIDGAARLCWRPQRARTCGRGTEEDLQSDCSVLQLRTGRSGL